MNRIISFARFLFLNIYIYIYIIIDGAPMKNKIKNEKDS